LKIMVNHWPSYLKIGKRNGCPSCLLMYFFARQCQTCQQVIQRTGVFEFFLALIEGRLTRRRESK